MRAILVVISVLAAVLFVCCDDNPVDDGNNIPPDPTKADQLATTGFQALGDSIQALQDRSTENLRDVRFDSIREQLEQALVYERNNGIAHLGLSIVEILELNYSSEIWEVVDSLDAWGGGVDDVIPPLQVSPRDAGHMLIGRQFELMATLPIATSMRMAMTFPSNVSLARIQNIIANTIQPALTRSIGHLSIVERQTDTGLRIHIDDNGVDEYIVIDLGEILVFSASVRALRAGFGAATAYDVDLWGRDGSYDWLDDIRDSRNCAGAATATVTDLGGGLVDLAFVGNYYGSSLEDSIWIDVAHYNLEDRDEFLSLRDNGAALHDAHADLLDVVDRLEDAAAFIRGRPIQTEENVIKLTNLTDLDADLGDPDGPNFAKNWTRVEDVIGFARNLLTGPVAFTEELGPNHIAFSWTTDLRAFFTSPVGDWNTLLPFHRWNLPAGAWLTVDSVYNTTWNAGGYDYCDWIRTGDNSCNFTCWPQANQISWRATYWDMDATSFLDLLDAPNGNSIDLDVVRFPYFADYTFHGLFPSMNRAKWLQLIDILDPPPGAYLAQARGTPR